MQKNPFPNQSKTQIHQIKSSVRSLQQKFKPKILKIYIYTIRSISGSPNKRRSKDQSEQEKPERTSRVFVGHGSNVKQVRSGGSGEARRRKEHHGDARMRRRRGRREF